MQEGQLEERLSRLWPLSTEQGPWCLFWLQREPLWGFTQGKDLHHPLQPGQQAYSLWATSNP